MFDPATNVGDSKKGKAPVCQCYAQNVVKQMSAADAATKSVAEADLGGHASRMTQNMADKLKEAPDDVVTAAFNPSRNPNT